MAILKTMNTYLGMYAESKIRRLALARKIPMTTLIAIAVDNEIRKEHPFEFDTTLPEKGDYEEYAFAAESNRIIEFLKDTNVKLDLSMLLLLRHDMDIHDKTTFLAAFKDCLDRNIIEPFTPTVRSDRPERPKWYVKYRIKPDMTPKKKRNKVSRYDKYIRFKKEFEKEE